jgi:hypothetical protein
MVDSIYDVLQVVLGESDELIPACNVWNFDETGHKVQYCRTFLYGLAGSQGDQAESVGNGNMSRSEQRQIWPENTLILRFCLWELSHLKQS